MISGWVRVIGPPLAICSRNRGTTEPEEPSTLPKRTIARRGPAAGSSWARAWITSSAARLLAPITLVGRTALSVEISVKLATPASTEAVARTWVASTLLARPARGLACTRGTCL